MTDYTKLIERLRFGQMYDHATGDPLDQSAVMDKAADAMEALQSECAAHKENAIRNARQAVAFRAERGALQASAVLKARNAAQACESAEDDHEMNGYGCAANIRLLKEPTP